MVWFQVNVDFPATKQMRSIHFATLGCLVACCILYCSGCGRNQSAAIASFSYVTSDIPKGEAFQHALESFLAENKFAAAAPPGTFLDSAGGHSSGATEIWMKGSYRGSLPFYLRYYMDQTPKTSVSMHGFILYGVHGDDSDMRKMTDTVNEFSKKLRDLAGQYDNEVPKMDTPDTGIR